MGIANKGGRPLKFKSPEELQQKIEAYYEWAEANKKHITISGLAWFIGTNRTTLLKYEDADCDLFKSITDEAAKVEFANTIKDAKARIEMESEERLYKKDSVVGSIFTMKNNFGYVDKQEQVIESKTIDVTLED